MPDRKIFKLRCNGARVDAQFLKEEIANIKSIEKYNATKFGTLDKFEKKWHNVKMSTQNLIIWDNFIADYMDQIEL